MGQVWITAHHDTLALIMISLVTNCANLLVNPWDWLNVPANGAAVQAAASVLSVLVGILTIAVLVITFRAINRQALAAEEQTKVSTALIKAAHEQRKATLDAAAAAKEQSRLLALQYEQSLAPLIVGRLSIGGLNNMMTMLELKNVGSGAAFGVMVTKGKVEIGAINKTYISANFSPSTLGAGEESELVFDTSVDNAMTVRYRGADLVERYTIMTNTNGFWQEHWVRRGTQFVGL